MAFSHLEGSTVGETVYISSYVSGRAIPCVAVIILSQLGARTTYLLLDTTIFSLGFPHIDLIRFMISPDWSHPLVLWMSLFL